MHRRYPTIATAMTALIAQACGLVTANDHDGGVRAVGGAGQGADGTSAGGTSAGNGIGGTISLGVPGGTAGAGLPDDCPKDILFGDQVVTQVGAQRTFYSWTTDEQVEELRGGVELFSRSERPGQGRGLLFTQLAEVAQVPENPGSALADVLVNEVFVKARFAWTNPWATLLGFPGESYGNQLLRIELKEEAWIAHLDAGRLDVFDANNELVPLETALATPERAHRSDFLRSAR
jgi:hypothetical protein